MAKCSDSGCDSHAQRHGLCNSHQEDDPHESSHKIRQPEQRAYALEHGLGKKQEVDQ